MKKQINYDSIGSIPYILTGVFSIFFLVTTIWLLLTIDSGEVEQHGLNVLIGPIVFMSIGFIGLIANIVLTIGKIRFNWKIASGIKTHLATINVEEAFFEPTTKISIEHYGKEHYIRKVGIDELSDISSKEAIDWNKIYPLIYQEKKVDQVCPICKLSIERKEFIMQCPNCLKLFHGKHLVEWLLENDTCPICQTRINIR